MAYLKREPSAGRIPIQYVRKHVLRFRDESSQDADPQDLAGTQVLYGLAIRAGVNYDTLNSWMTRAKSISFEDADRLFCAMDRPDLWHVDPDLAAWYG